MKKLSLHSNSMFLKLSFCFLFLQTTFAQNPITNSQELKTACETAPGNVITLSTSTKIAEPRIIQEAVANCPCTIILTNEATLEFEQSRITFTGALNIQSANKGGVKLTKSILKAASIAISLGGEGSQINTSQSEVQAVNGDLTFNLGKQSKMELYSVFTIAYRETISSSGTTKIIAGERFTASIADMTIGGQNGVFLEFNGFENLLKIENTAFIGHAGPVIVNSDGNNNMLEASRVSFLSNTAVSILYPGNEASLKLNKINFSGAPYETAIAGDVTILAGSGTAQNGKIEMIEVATGAANGAFIVSASKTGEKGTIKTEKSNITFNGAISFETGTLGSTEVKDNKITSLKSITALTGTNGNCVSSPNLTLSAPELNLCGQPTLSARLNLKTASLFNIYPNPSNGSTVKINLLDTKGEKSFELFDITGKAITKYTTKSETVEINNLQKGLYIVKITSIENNEAQTKKLLIN